MHWAGGVRLGWGRCGRIYAACMMCGGISASAGEATVAKCHKIDNLDSSSGVRRWHRRHGGAAAACGHAVATATAGGCGGRRSRVKSSARRLPAAVCRGPWAMGAAGRRAEVMCSMLKW
eukprot:scaffold12096_cov105-Isochrysis_galbana.AAC.2